MALGRYSRVDGRRSSSTSSTVVFVVFIGLCLVGVWMMTSSSIVPAVQNVDDTKNEVQTQLKEIGATSKSNGISEEETSSESESNTRSDTYSDVESNASSNTNSDNTSGENTSRDVNSNSRGGDENKSQSKNFHEDNPGTLPEDSTEGDNVKVSSNERTISQPEKTSQGSADYNLEQKPAKQSRDQLINLEERPKSGTGYEEDTKEDVVSNTKDQESKVSENQSETDEKNSVDEKSYSKGQGDSEDDLKATTSKSNEEKDKPENSSEPENKDKSKTEDTIQEKSEEISSEKNDLLPSAAQSELLNETMDADVRWKTQAAESKKEAEKSEPARITGSGWKVCNVTAGPDYIPCLDNLQAIRSLRSRGHFQHRERHCPDDPPTCLVSLPENYQRSIQWPTSREKIWYHNVPHTQLAEYKGHQNWVKVSGEYLAFPGGGTQMIRGALTYIDTIQKFVPDIAWGKQSRVALDVGCGVASFGGFLFDRDSLVMSFAPKDEHQAQVQFALERGIPAIVSVMGTKRLPFPGKVFDVVHCARCRVPWHAEGGKLLLELNRVLRPGGYFVWSATPVYEKEPEDVQIWEAMKKLLKAICWEVISIYKDKKNRVGVAVFKKPYSNECYEKRSEEEPPLCKDSDDPNASWNVPLQACMHKIPTGATERGSKWPEQWPARMEKPPYWLLSSQVGIYGKPAPDDFVADYKHWKRVVSTLYVTGMGIDWSTVRNVMDMRAIYGGFAAALREMKVWVMNVVNIDSPDTLPIIYERGLIGMYHDWCESFNTYPRTYDLIHADHLFSYIKTKCNFEALVVEVDRILRPEGKLIVRDTVQIISELETMYKSMQWDVRMTYAKDTEGFLCVQKSMWRPREAITLPYAIADKADIAREMKLKEDLKKIPRGNKRSSKSKSKRKREKAG
ncbi:putative methyltransferase PMT26 [Heracleum sosnowskyi]|uniref:Methyltransferase PMT26 n=1 Tax=Heracleum sosnowskyi TaxID=360622 RepID=A0AAD8N127_9APIA|nr:putative methyltransferase PMT26 [Heracleum sosnowskyi]